MKKPVIAIVANGEPPSKALIEKYLPEADLVIAADGGANICKELQVKPNYIVGDLDSITEETRQYFSDTTIMPMVDQNFSDLQKTIAFALTHDPQRLIILAAFGKRADHTFSNLLVAAGLDTDVPIEILDNWGRLTWLKAGKHTVNGTPGHAVSLFSIHPLQKLTLSGFKFNLENTDYKMTFNGTSNQFESDTAEIAFTGGPLFVYWPFKQDDKG